jgi:hypothetical protein
MIAGAKCDSATVGIEGTVALSLGRVAAQLPRDRRGCPTQPIRDLPDAQPRVAQIGDLDPLVLDKNLGLISRTVRRSLTKHQQAWGSSAGTNPPTRPWR